MESVAKQMQEKRFSVIKKGQSRMIHGRSILLETVGNRARTRRSHSPRPLAVTKRRLPRDFPSPNFPWDLSCYKMMMDTPGTCPRPFDCSSWRQIKAMISIMWTGRDHGVEIHYDKYGLAWSVCAGLAVGSAEMLSFFVSSLGVQASQFIPIIIGGSVMFGAVLGILEYWARI